MHSNLVNLTYEVNLAPGEKLSLPPTLVETVGAGRWLIIIRPSTRETTSSLRDHSPFLNSYAPEDEGLYDDYISTNDANRLLSVWTIYVKPQF